MRASVRRQRRERRQLIEQQPRHAVALDTRLHAKALQRTEYGLTAESGSTRTPPPARKLLHAVRECALGGAPHSVGAGTEAGVSEEFRIPTAEKHMRLSHDGHREQTMSHAHSVTLVMCTLSGAEVKGGVAVVRTRRRVTRVPRKARGVVKSVVQFVRDSVESVAEQRGVAQRSEVHEPVNFASTAQRTLRTVQRTRDVVVGDSAQLVGAVRADARAFDVAHAFEQTRSGSADGQCAAAQQRRQRSPKSEVRSLLITQTVKGRARQVHQKSRWDLLVRGPGGAEEKQKERAHSWAQQERSYARTTSARGRCKVFVR